MAEPRSGSPTETRPGPLDRLLRVFSDVRAGEAGTVLLMTLNLFLLLVGYYIVKTAREPLILATGGAELKSYASAGQALTLMGFIPLYSWLSSRVDRMKLIVILILFFAVNIELFYLGALAGVPYLGVVFFIWVGIFSLASIAQFWSYGNDLYRREAGERLFPIIVIGQTAGAPLGAKLAEVLFEAGIGAYAMLHITTVLLVVHLGLYRLVDRREAGRPGQAQASHQALAAGDGFALVLRSPYLKLVALLLVLLNTVNTTGEYIIGRTVVEHARAAAAANPAISAEAFIGSFYGNYYFWVNIATVLIQAFLVSRIVKHLGLAGVLLTLPVVAMGAYGLIGAGAGFAAIRWAKTAENSTDYSIMNTARQMIWLPTTREEKYKAKQAADTFFVRFGDLLSAGLVFVGTTWLALGVRGFAAANLVLVVVWLGVGWLVLREYRTLIRRRAAEAETAA